MFRGMTRSPLSSARTVAFAAAFCALSIAPGCGRQTFELLSGGAPSTAGSGAVAGSPQSGGAGYGGNAGIAGIAGTAGASGGGKTGGGGGKAGGGGMGGMGGRFGTNPPCLGEGGCPNDEEPVCTPSSPFYFCIPCSTAKDCDLAGDADICDFEHERCVQCINDFQCGFGEGCNRLNQHCAKACDGNNDSCAEEGQHLSCNRELGVCVVCTRNDDCEGYGPNTHCYQSVCVECFDDSHCSSQSCVKGRCKP
jgi:hypothetical protein